MSRTFSKFSNFSSAASTLEGLNGVGVDRKRRRPQLVQSSMLKSVFLQPHLTEITVIRLRWCQTATFAGHEKGGWVGTALGLGELANLASLEMSGVVLDKMAF